MADLTNGISWYVAQYVYNQTNGAVTEPVNGDYIQAYCEHLGITEPSNASWLQALCEHFSITEPLYGSWTIALANYYSLTNPVNGSWWGALAGATAPSPELIWETANNNWEAETTLWSA